MEHQGRGSFTVSSISSPWAKEVELVTNRRKVKKNSEKATRKMAKGRRRIKADENTSETNADKPEEADNNSFRNSILKDRNVSDTVSPVPLKKGQNKSNGHESPIVLVENRSKRITRSKAAVQSNSETTETNKRRQSNEMQAFLNKFCASEDSLLFNNSIGVSNFESPPVLERSRKRWTKPLMPIIDLIKKDETPLTQRRKTLRSSRSVKGTPKLISNTDSVDVDEENLPKSTRKNKTKHITSLKSFLESLSDSDEETPALKPVETRKSIKSGRKRKSSNLALEKTPLTSQNNDDVKNKTLELEKECVDLTSDNENNSNVVQEPDLSTETSNKSINDEYKTGLKNDAEKVVKRNKRKNKRKKKKLTDNECSSSGTEKDVKNCTFEKEEKVKLNIGETDVKNRTFEIEENMKNNDGTEDINRTFEMEEKPEENNVVTDVKNRTFEIEEIPEENKGETEVLNSTFETQRSSKKNNTFEVESNGEHSKVGRKRRSTNRSSRGIGSNETRDNNLKKHSTNENESAEEQTNSQKTEENIVFMQQSLKKNNTFEIEANDDCSKVGRKRKSKNRSSRGIETIEAGDKNLKEPCMNKNESTIEEQNKTEENIAFMQQSSTKNNTFEIASNDDCSKVGRKRRSKNRSSRGIESNEAGDKNLKKHRMNEIKSTEENGVAVAAGSPATKKRRTENNGTQSELISPSKIDTAAKADSTLIKESKFQKPLTPITTERVQSSKSSQKKSANKVPNYSKIHQKALEKMENLGDYMERKKARAQALLSGSKVKIGLTKNTPSRTPTIMKELFPTSSANKLPTNSFNTSKITPLKGIGKTLLSDRMNNSGKASLGKTPNMVKALLNKMNDSVGGSKKKIFSSTPKQPNLLNRLKHEKSNTKNISTNNLSFKNSMNKKIKSPNKICSKNVPSKIPLKMKNSIEKKRIAIKMPPVKESALPAKNVRVEMAKSIISKTRVKTNDSTNDKRSIIKGVRSNRRFDLLMSMRKIN